MGRKNLFSTRRPRKLSRSWGAKGARTTVEIPDDAAAPEPTKSLDPERTGPIEKLWFVHARSYTNTGLDGIAMSPGLNVITGDSDSGKSNLVRNLRSLVENDSFDALASTGEPYAKVSALFAGGVMVELEKHPRKKSNRYVGDPGLGAGSIEFESVGVSAPPPAIADLLNMGPVDLAGAPVDLNIAPQRGPALGVDDPPARLARIVGSVSGLDVVYRAAARAAGSLRALRAEGKALRGVFEGALARYRAAKAEADPEAVEGLLAAARQAEVDHAGLDGEAVDLQGLIDSALAAAGDLAKARGDVLVWRTLISRTAAAESAADSEVSLAARWSAALGDADRAITGLRGSREWLGEANAELIQSRNAEREYLASCGACPVCGAETNREAV